MMVKYFYVCFFVVSMVVSQAAEVEFQMKDGSKIVASSSMEVEIDGVKQYVAKVEGKVQTIYSRDVKLIAKLESPNKEWEENTKLGFAEAKKKENSAKLELQKRELDLKIKQNKDVIAETERIVMQIPNDQRQIDERMKAIKRQMSNKNSAITGPSQRDMIGQLTDQYNQLSNEYSLRSSELSSWKIKLSIAQKTDIKLQQELDQLNEVISRVSPKKAENQKE